MEDKLARTNIKKLRLEKGWTQSDLGKQFKKTKSPEIISRWENGVSIPSPLSLMELSKIFKTNMEDILIDCSRNQTKSEVL